MRPIVQYILRWADDALIMSHSLSTYASYGPFLEEDLAISNVALDYLGQAESLLNYAAEIMDDGTTADDLAYKRTEKEFRNCQIVELPNDDFAVIIVRQFLYDVYNFHTFTALKEVKDPTLAAIATKSLKEITYHLKRSSEWMIRLGRGTEVSKEKMQNALDNLWKYTGELFEMNDIEEELISDNLAIDLDSIKPVWTFQVEDIVKRAGLEIPESSYFVKGGRDGHHTEYMGKMLAEMQYLPRTYPDATW